MLWIPVSRPDWRAESALVNRVIVFTFAPLAASRVIFFAMSMAMTFFASVRIVVTDRRHKYLFRLGAVGLDPGPEGFDLLWDA